MALAHLPQDVIVLEADWPRFFCVAYYESEPDYINILLSSFVTETAAIAEVIAVEL